MNSDEKKKDLEYKNSLSMSLLRDDNIKKREDQNSNLESRDTGFVDEYNNKYSLYALNSLIKDNASFVPVVESISVNTVGFGYSIKPRIKNYDNNEYDKTENYAKIENYFRYINADQDLTELSKQLVTDYCNYGYACCEITRDPQNKKINGMYRIQPDRLKLCRKHDDPTLYNPKRIIRDVSGTYLVKPKVEAKRFRQFTYYMETGKYIYFKEFQDPTEYDRNTGEIINKKRELNAAIKFNNLANELWFIGDVLHDDVYPIPKYSGAIIDALGDVSAAKTNASTLRTNLVPNLAIIGDLDKDSIERIKEFQEQRVNNTYNRARILLLRADPDDTNPMDVGDKKIQIEKLKDEQITDAMFQEYREFNTNRILQAFRLPAALIAKGDDIKDRSTLESALKFADEQVFNPIRVKFQRFLNDYLLPEFGIADLVIQYNTPDVTDPRTLIDLVRFFESSGAITPERADIVLEFILGKKLPDIQGIDAKTPYSKTMAESVKNTKDPTNINQQVVGERIGNPAKDSDKYQDRKNR